MFGMWSGCGSLQSSFRLKLSQSKTFQNLSKTVGLTQATNPLVAPWPLTPNVFTRLNLSYPIILSAEGYLMDGGHRIAKAWLQGVKEIRAVQFEIDPEPDEVRPK